MMALRFNGSDYVPLRDDVRLASQYQRIFSLMSDGKWRSLTEISRVTGDPSPSVSAQLRHMRKLRFGSHKVEKRYQGEGLYEYRVVT